MNAPAWQRRAVLAMAALALLVLVVLVQRNTEWVDETLPRAYTGKAAESETYALARLLERTGAVAVSRTDLAELPPRDATLLLLDWDWGVLPESDRALRAWVETGGQLVLPRASVASLGNGGWIPVETRVPAPRDRRGGARAARPVAPAIPPPRTTPAPTLLLRLRDAPCRPVREPPDTPIAYTATEKPLVAVDDAAGAPAAAGGETAAPSAPAVGDETAPGADAGPAPEPALQLCTFGAMPLASTAPTLWALQSGERDTEILRVALGHGSVTVLPGTDLLQNHDLLRGDDSLIAIAALQAGAGRQVWIVSPGAARGLLAWIWEYGRSAVLAALIALALWLWRASVRFGPAVGPAPATRRSMIEQITGTAEFLWRRSPAALHAAQLRALDEAAARRVRDYAAQDGAARAAAIARTTGYDAGALALAMDGAAATRSGALGARLATLELARRALAARPARLATQSPASKALTPHPGDER
jgi:hypothetical protein